MKQQAAGLKIRESERERERERESIWQYRSIFREREIEREREREILVSNMGPFPRKKRQKKTKKKQKNKKQKKQKKRKKHDNRRYDPGSPGSQPVGCPEGWLGHYSQEHTNDTTGNPSADKLPDQRG